MTVRGYGMRFKLVSTIIALIIISSIGSSQYHQEDHSSAISYSTSDLHNLTPEIILQKVNFSIGESVNWTYEIHNSGDEWINLSWGSIPYYDYGFDSSSSTSFWEWPYMEPPHVMLPVIKVLDIPPHGNASISPIEGWHLENISSGYYRVWLALLGFPELSALTYFIVGNQTSEVTANFSQSISYDASTGHYHLTTDSSISTNLFDDNSALEFRWDWESDGIWDTNWSHDPLSSHVFDSAGNHSIRLGVRDVLGDSNTITKTIDIQTITLNDILTTVRTDKPVYEKGENITITISIFNPTNASINLYGPSYPPFYFSIEDESGHTVGGQGWRMAMNTYDTIGPNETIDFEKTYKLQLDPGFYLINGTAYDAPYDQTWFRINGTGETLPSGYDSTVVGVVFLLGIASGMVAAFLYFRRKTK
jgi:hypothetical protein